MKNIVSFFDHYSKTVFMRLDDLIQATDQCVKCGLCLPVCPTYQLNRQEGASPRGRIALAQGLATHQLKWDKKLAKNIDGCLYCAACETICPSNVQYYQIIDQIKADYQPFRMKNWLLAIWITHPLYLKIGLKLGQILSACHWRYPAYLFQLLKQITANQQPVGAKFEAKISKKERIALFMGCISQEADKSALKKAQYILELMGYQVDIPIQQRCCGAIHRHAGMSNKADQFIQKNAQILTNYDFILTIASGCQRELKSQLNHLPIFDAVDFISEQKWSFSLKAESKTIILHQPCSQKTSGKIWPRLPQIKVIPLTNQQCCGAGGLHLITQNQQSRQLCKKINQAIEQFQADYVVTSNTGCKLNLGIETLLPIKHPIELLYELIVK